MSIPEDLLEYWKDLKIIPPSETVVCAANRLKDGTIICGARHWDGIMCCLSDKLKSDDIDCGNVEQGFINQWGIFLTRKEAMKVVKKSGQPFNQERNGGSDGELYSEGLY